MVSTIADLRNQGLAPLGVGIIKLYQKTISQVTPPRCRYTPSCSEYAIEAIQNFGLEEGIRLTSQRIKRCKRPYGGHDPVPTHLAINSNSERNICSDDISQENFETIKEEQNPLEINNFDHQFKLILSYPTNREFYSQEDLKRKLAEFHEYVLEISQYAILYKVDKVEVGIINDYYLIRFSGTTSSAYLENQVDEVIGLIITQLEAFFTVVQEKEFQPLYFEVDGQVYLKPEPNQPAVPQEYSPEKNFWAYTSDTNVWDYYWDSYLISDLFELFFNTIESVADVVENISLNNDVNKVDTDLVNPLETDEGIEGGDIGDEGCNLSEFEGCDDTTDGCNDMGEGCSNGVSDGFENVTDGCGDVGSGCSDVGDGCDMGDGCSGCDVGDGCDGCSW